jgi:hypothetical protein
MTAALFTGKPMTCLERIENMLSEYLLAARLLGVLVGMRRRAVARLATEVHQGCPSGSATLPDHRCQVSASV